MEVGCRAVKSRIIMWGDIMRSNILIKFAQTNFDHPDQNVLVIYTMYQKVQIVLIKQKHA